jgi:RimJ/RimL family protein N-acetyltransferase
MLVKLRELERTDLPALNSWRNDAEVVEHLGANFLYIAPEIDARWYDGYVAARDRTVRLAILDPDLDRMVGCVYLTDINRINRSAEFSILIGDKAYWSKGFGTAATKAMLAHAFDDLNLHRIYLSVLAENLRAIRLYEKVGFRVEGRQRDAVFKKGRYWDVMQMAVLKAEYREIESGAGAESAEPRTGN